MNKKQVSITYDEVSDRFKKSDQPTLPAELHGYLCGLICSGHCTVGTSGFRLPEALLQDDVFTSEEQQKMVGHLMVIALEQLKDPDFEFQLMLPDDEADLSLRLHALAKWCGQFLSGLGAGGINQELINNTNLSEMLYDLSEIARADYRKLEKDNEAEIAYLELVEYVRVSVMTFFAETVG